MCKVDVKSVLAPGRWAVFSWRFYGNCVGYIYQEPSMPYNNTENVKEKLTKDALLIKGKTNIIAAVFERIAPSAHPMLRRIRYFPHILRRRLCSRVTTVISSRGICSPGEA